MFRIHIPGPFDKVKERRLVNLGLFLPLLSASFALFVVQCAFVSLPAAASCIPLALGAAVPVAAVVSEEPQNAPCFPAAISGNHVAEWILQAH